MAKILSFLFVMAVAVSGVVQASPATTCDELKALNRTQIASGAATIDAFLDCIRRGDDPPKHLRNKLGMVPIVTPFGNMRPGAPCRPGAVRQCPNNLRKYTDGSNSPPGYNPATNPKLNIPELPWGSLSDTEIPCGAIATFAEEALQSLLGKARVNVPLSLNELNTMMTGITNEISSLQSLLTGISNGTLAQSTAQAQASTMINNIGAQVTALLGQVPKVGSQVQGPANDLLNQLTAAVSTFIQNQNTMPPAQVNAQITAINTQLTALQTALNPVVSVVSNVQGAADGVISDLKGQINGAITGLVGNFFKYKDCQDGKFWGILNHVFTLVMGKGTYTFDVSNNTFISPINTYVTLPLGTTISITGGTSTPIILPNGGSFMDAQGFAVTVPKGAKTKFRSDGLVLSSTGDRYRVNPRQEVVLDPHGILEIPARTRIPVDPKGKVYPAGAITKMPAWFNDGYAKAAK